MSTKLTKLKADLDTAKTEEAEAQKTVQAAANADDKSAAADLLEAASKTRLEIEAEIEKLEQVSKTKPEPKSNAKQEAKSQAKTQTKTTSKSGAQQPLQDSEGPTSETKKRRGPAVNISSANPRRRAGMRFGPKPITVYREEITDAQWQAIDNDPVLKVASVKE